MSSLLLFIVQAALVIACARLAGLVARRLRQPMVVAEIVAGIALGPSLLGWLSPGAEAAIFPTGSLSHLSIVSQIGLLLFMFLVGLEFDAEMLRGRARAAVTISHSSIIVPFGLGLLFAMIVDSRLSSPSVPFRSFAMFMGVSMSITAFPVLARILSEQRMLRSEIGAMAIACAAVDDITCWCILAFILALVRATTLAGAVVTVVMAVGYTALMIGFVRRLANHFADRMPAVASQRLVAITILSIFASSAITELIGIHALFGAFLCGTVIPRHHGIPGRIAGKLDDLVEVFMLPLFFAFSGLRTEIGLLDHGRDWLLCLLVIVVACLGKFGGSIVAARLSGFGWRQSSAIGILMNTRGLVELVVLNIGYDLGLVSSTLFTMLVIMALVTTFMTSPLLRWVYPVVPPVPTPSPLVDR
ncbi:MAG TPA: cation:proton antiporter [Kofleriaceae bacterium]|nr:cation:proton antiporter [Kofleriaceae bacterium]